MKDQLRHIALSAYVLLAFLLTVFTVYLCFALEWRGPMRDLWEFMGEIEQQLHGQWNWRYLIEPYGGIHRILLPKLMFYLDYRYFSGSNLFSLNLTLLLHISSAALMLWSIQQFSAFKNREKILLAATSLFFFFSTTQIYNLIYTSDNQVVISHVLAIWAAWLFAKEKIILAHLLVALACLSHSSSLMLLPAMALLLASQRYPYRIIFLQIIFSLMLLFLYVSGYDPLEKEAAPLSLWQQILTALYSFAIQLEGIFRYIGLYLGSPTSRLWPIAGIITSYLSIAYLFSWPYRLYKRIIHLHSSEFFWLTLALYIFFVAFITAYGRQIYPNSALTDRYQTLVMTYWAALLILLYLDLKRYQASLTLLSPAIALALLIPHQFHSATEMAWLSARVSRAHTAAIVGITDIEIVAATLSHPLLMDKKNLVATYNDFLRDNKLGYFSSINAQYFNHKDTYTIFNEEVIADKNCSAELQQMTRLNNGVFRLEGKAIIDQHPVANLLVIDQKNHILGYARDMRQKGEFKPLAFRDAANTQWAGFIQTQKPQMLSEFPLRLIAKNSSGYYCELMQINDLPED